MTSKKVAVVAGVGPGIGGALARRFAAAGYQTALLARDIAHANAIAADVPGSLPLACDVGDAASVKAAFAEIRAKLGPVDALLYNAGSGSFTDIEATTAAQFESAYRTNALGALLCSQEVIGEMKAKGAGDIVFTGATASRRGGAKTAGFAPAKAAQRSLAESMARHLWPAGIHVALIIVDGVVDLPRTRKAMPDKKDDFFVDPAGVAEVAYQLTQQSKQAWSFEVEARPFTETW